MTKYCQVVNNSLATYATNDVTADVAAKVTNFKQPEGISAVCYSRLLWKRHYAAVLYKMSHARREFSSKSYMNAFVYQQEHTGVQRNMQLCRTWHDMGYPCESYRSD